MSAGRSRSRSARSAALLEVSRSALVRALTLVLEPVEGGRWRRRAFTLLEVMVALAILGLALTAIAGIDAVSFESSNYAKHITVATLLARSKMIDVEEEIRKDGFSDSDKEYDGDFEKEGYPGITFVASVRKVELDVGQLIGSFLGGDVGELAADQLPQEMQELLKALTGEGSKALQEKVDGSQLKQLMGGDLGGAVFEAMFKQVSKTLGDSIREITLEIRWGREGIDADSVKFVQYVTKDGRLTMAPPPEVDPAAGGRNPETLVPGGNGTGGQGANENKIPGLQGLPGGTR